MEDSWCALPFSSVTVHADGSASPCCKLIGRDSTQNYYQSGVRAALNSPLFQDLQRQFRNNQRPEACRKCWNNESQGVQSLRRGARERNPELKRDELEARPRLRTLDLAFGNTCNLACVTCDSHSSHKWLPESQALYARPGNPFERWPLPAQSHLPEWSLTDLSDLQQIFFDKAEPFLQPGFEPFLQHLHQRGILSRLHLVLSTNATYWPKPSVLELLTQVRALEIQLSIDATNVMGEFLRYPSRWSDVNQIARRWMDWALTRGKTRMLCRMTLSALNLLEEEQVRTWWLGLGGKKLSYGIVYNPWYLSPMVLPQTARDTILAAQPVESVRLSLRQSPDWHPQYARRTEPERLHMLKQFLEALEVKRGLRLREASPRMAEFIYAIN